jgi:para-nitrobenzyl esterase
LNLFRTTRNWSPYDRELADKMSDCLVAFARTGDPATEAVAWPAWIDGSEQYVEFGDAIAVRAENVDRMQFQSKAGVTSTTPSASHD